VLAGASGSLSHTCAIISVACAITAEAAELGRHTYDKNAIFNTATTTRSSAAYPACLWSPPPASTCWCASKYGSPQVLLFLPDFDTYGHASELCLHLDCLLIHADVRPCPSNANVVNCSTPTDLPPTWTAAVAAGTG